ncbi:hypothetical protein TNCV_537611 [Trichonephila clavipes]|nr:hypothetical protein TNCV_537611 [Trichonephila clavipes]
MMVWDAIGYSSQSPRARTNVSLNSVHYISGVSRPMTQPFIREFFKTLRLSRKIANRMFVAGVVRTFLDAENVRLLLWSARSPDLPPIKNVLCMLAE